MPAKPCLVCGALSPRSRCAFHGQPNRTGAPIAERDRRRFRARTVEAGGRRCARCGSTENVEAHHLRMLSEGGDPQGTGVLLCVRCHYELHAEQWMSVS